MGKGKRKEFPFPLSAPHHWHLLWPFLISFIPEFRFTSDASCSERSSWCLSLLLSVYFIYPLAKKRRSMCTLLWLLDCGWRCWPRWLKRACSAPSNRNHTVIICDSHSAKTNRKDGFNWLRFWGCRTSSSFSTLVKHYIVNHKVLDADSIKLLFVTENRNNTMIILTPRMETCVQNRDRVSFLPLGQTLCIANHGAQWSRAREWMREIVLVLQTRNCQFHWTAFFFLRDELCVGVLSRGLIMDRLLLRLFPFRCWHFPLWQFSRTTLSFFGVWFLFVLCLFARFLSFLRRAYGYRCSWLWSSLACTHR